MEKGCKNHKETLSMYVVDKPCIIYRTKRADPLILSYTANFYPMKTMGTGNYGIPAEKTCTIYEKESQRNSMYVVDKPCNIYRLRGNPMIIMHTISQGPRRHRKSSEVIWN